MQGTFLLLFAGALAVVGWLLSQLIFFVLARKRGKLQQRLTTGVSASTSSAYRPIVLAKEEDSLRAIVDGRAVIGEFSRRLGQAYPGVTLAKFLLIEMIVVMGAFASAGFLT